MTNMTATSLQNRFRICMLIRLLPTHTLGGMQEHALDLAKELVRAGHQVMILTTSHPSGRTTEEIDGVRVRYIPETPPEIYSEAWFRNSAKYVEILLREQAIDLIHSQSIAISAPLIRLTQRTYNRPVVMSLHGTTWDEILTKLRADFTLRQPRQAYRAVRVSLSWFKKIITQEMPLLRKLDVIIATSPTQRKIIHYGYGVPFRKIAVALNGIDTHHFCPGAAPAGYYADQFGIPPDRRVVLAIARFVKDKGLQYLIRAFPAVLQRAPDAHLVIVGDGEYRSELEHLRRQHQLQDRVTFSGFVDPTHLPQLLRACTVFVNATIRQNGYDLTILEAMACEKPVVVSDLGSIPDVVRHLQNGLLVPSGKVPALAAAISEILNRPDLARHVGQSGRAAIAAQFSLEHMLEGTFRAYWQAIECQTQRK